MWVSEFAQSNVLVHSPALVGQPALDLLAWRRAEPWTGPSQTLSIILYLVAEIWARIFLREF